MKLWNEGEETMDRQASWKMTVEEMKISPAWGQTKPDLSVEYFDVECYVILQCRGVTSLRCQECCICARL